MLKNIVSLILFLGVTQLYAQKTIYFKTLNEKSIVVKLNNDPGVFPFDEIPNPFEIGLPKNSKLDFVLPNDSLQVVLKEKITISIYRQEKRDTIKLHFNPVDIVTFDPAFKNKHDGKVNIDIPEVYELMNVLIATTPTGIADKNLIYTSSDYYKSVLSYFTSYKTEKAVLVIDTLLKNDNYYNLKMDSYSFLFNDNDEIVPHPNYHVINWSNINSISPTLLKEMNEFARKSNFRTFYTNNREVYKEQIRFYKKDVDFGRMVSWLSLNFPTTKYNYYNVLFSPLVYGNQSTQHFEDNGFKEAQLHVNFPYYNQEQAKAMRKSYKLFRGNILFTELNHNFINPEAEKYATKIKSILTDLSKWEETGKAAQLGYPSPMACFDEYMNWGLVSLYLSDYSDPKDLPVIIENLNSYMTNYRGFTKFTAFNEYLLSLYKSKKSKTTVADLYPQIINWFEKNNN